MYKYGKKYRRLFVNGGGIDYSSSAVAPSINNTYQPNTELNTQASYTQPAFGGYGDDGSSYEVDSSYDNISQYSNLVGAGVDAIGYGGDYSGPRTDKQQYANSQVSQSDPGSTYEDLSYAITDLNPLSQAAHSIGSGISDALAPVNAEGYSDSSNFAVGLSGVIDPGRTTDYAMQQFDEGDTWEGILGLVSPYYAADVQNREAKTAAKKANREYSAQKVFDKNTSYYDTNRYNKSIYGDSYQLEMGGSMKQGKNLSYSNGGNIQKEFINNGKGTIYNGPTHNQGGIPLGDNTEVENNEVKYGSYIFSDKINYNG